ncbi:MAG: SdpA family antimicrobial peptide system protein [Cyclobacteriaceae bacterium]
MNTKKINLFLGSVLLAWIGVIVFISTAAIQYSPISASARVTANTQMIMPEGWAFFTRNPREKDLLIYRKVNGQWESNPHWPIANPINLFGISRVPRAQSSEAAMLLKKLPDEKWTACKDDLLKCLHCDTLEVTILETAVPKPLLQDTLAFAMQEPVPWAWGKSYDKINKPSHFVKVVVQ